MLRTIVGTLDFTAKPWTRQAISHFAQGANPVISGAEIIDNWTVYLNNVWRTEVRNSLFGLNNPYKEELFGDWYDSLGQTHHTGEVFLNGEAIGFHLISNMDGMKGVGGIYLYRKNLQGDITGIIGQDGQLLAEFTYDAYGNFELHPIANNLGGVFVGLLMIVITPQLYRGYIYVPLGGDVCYYLGSRFYSPRLGRFLHADKHTDTGTGVVGTNMFAYCDNNPIMLIDPSGELSIKTLMKILAVIITPVARYVQNRNAIQLLKDIGVFPYEIQLYSDNYNHESKIVYNEYVITHRNDFDNNNFALKMQLTNVLYPKRNVSKYLYAIFEYQTVEYWVKFISMSINDILMQQLPGYETVRKFRDENAIAFDVLSDIATGTLGDILQIWDIIEMGLDLIIDIAEENGFMFPKQRYVAEELKRQGVRNGWMTIVTYANYYEITSYWWSGPYKSLESIYDPY